LAQQRTDAAHAVVLAVAEASESAVEAVKSLRAAWPVSNGVPLLVWGRNLPDPFLLRVYEEGADGDLPSTSSSAYVQARALALQRRIDPSAKAAVPVVAAASQDQSPCTKVTASGAWGSLHEQLRSAVAKFLSLDVVVMDLPLAPPTLAFASGITLLNAAQEMELRISLGASSEAAKKLAVHLFGPECDDLEGDMLSEIANICMGTLRTALGNESLPFAAGLPETIDAETVLRPSTPWKVTEAFSLAVNDEHIIVNVGLRSKGNSKVQPTALQEGMVVAKDVFNLRGLLLVRGGTRLSQNMIDKLLGALPRNQAVEVSAQ
jgi:CheY-specific phosphatase CheX